jgi:hypothetical protein
MLKYNDYIRKALFHGGDMLVKLVGDVEKMLERCSSRYVVNAHVVMFP